MLRSPFCVSFVLMNKNAPMTPVDRLARIKALQPIRRRPVTASVVECDVPPGFSPEKPAGAERLAEILGAQLQHNSFGEHLVLRRWFSEPVGAEVVGVQPSGILDASVLRLLLPILPSCADDPQNWLFIDTETTGLAGGTGTYPFLIGVAWWDAGGLEIEQFFMREQSEEHSVLVTLAERIAKRSVIVSFNGKSFDWPLLEKRYRMTRAIDPPVPRAHIDFLYPARHLWRLRLGSVRLAELERHILGWNRGADVISELIPQLYFDYLRGGPPEPLSAIFLHNQMDLRGLAGVATRVLGLLEDSETLGRDPLELFGLSRICERRGEAVRARNLYERSIASALPPRADRLARRSLARLAKRDGDHTRACQLWEQLLDGSKEGLEAYEQLAIYYEHRLRRPNHAATLVRKALAELRRASLSGILAPSALKAWRLRFQRRLARLEPRASGILLDTPEPESKAAPAESNREGKICQNRIA